MTLLTFLGAAIVLGVVVGVSWRFLEDWFEKRSARQVQAALEALDATPATESTTTAVPVTVTVATNTSKSN
jgi:hypothetical protein